MKREPADAPTAKRNPLGGTPSFAPSAGVPSSLEVENAAAFLKSAKDSEEIGSFTKARMSEIAMLLRQMGARLDQSACNPPTGVARQKSAGLCMYCGHVFHAADTSEAEVAKVYAEAIAHDQQCPDNPLVKKLAEANRRIQDNAAEAVASSVELTLKADAHQSATDAWQPIATAPRDRNIILTDGERACEGGWLSSVDQGADYEDQGGAPSPGWWSVGLSGEPTHWQPLPEVPSPDSESKA